MKTMAKFCAYIIAVSLLFELCGCASGQWVPYNTDRATPGNHLYWSHGKPNIDINADTTLTVKGFEFERSGLGVGKGKIEEMVFANNTSPYWAGTHIAQQGSNQAATIWSTMTIPAYEKYAETVLDKTFVAALPLVSQWIGGRQQVDMLNAQKQPAIIELAKLILGNGLSQKMREQVQVAAPDILKAAEDLAAGQSVTPVEPPPPPKMVPSTFDEDDHLKQLS